MICEETALILSRLVKGRNRLEQEDMLRLIEDLKRNSTDEVLLVLYSPQPKLKKPRTPTPEWLKEMQSAQKQVSWRAPEAIEQLYALANDAGFSSTNSRKKSFPAAAKEIAQRLGAEETKEMFVGWVNEYVRKHKMV
tara:strand:- start:166 stop:576 length:411 start_codon:yes stop_codon:yes gene_type:complete